METQHPLPLSLPNSLLFIDLETPVSGIPIIVTHTYDSLNANYTDLRTSLRQDETYDETDIRTLGFSLPMVKDWFSHRFQRTELNHSFL